MCAQTVFSHTLLKPHFLAGDTDGLKVVPSKACLNSDVNSALCQGVRVGWSAHPHPAAPCLSAGEFSCRLCAVTGIDVPSHISSVVGGEVGKEGGDFLRLGVAAERDLTIHFRKHLVSVLGALHGGHNVA